VLTANVGLPHHSIREAIALAIHTVVHIARVGRSRVVTEAVFVSGYDYRSDRFEFRSDTGTQRLSRPRAGRSV
jgi:Flp pilus assembly CpaF family ATPase